MRQLNIIAWIWIFTHWALNFELHRHQASCPQILINTIIYQPNRCHNSHLQQTVRLSPKSIASVCACLMHICIFEARTQRWHCYRRKQFQSEWLVFKALPNSHATAHSICDITVAISIECALELVNASPIKCLYLYCSLTRTCSSEYIYQLSLDSITICIGCHLENCNCTVWLSESNLRMQLPHIINCRVTHSKWNGTQTAKWRNPTKTLSLRIESNRAKPT